MINVDVFLSFRNDLRNGMTLENALLKYGLSLQEAVQYGHRTDLDNKYRYIHLVHNSFHIRRTIDGRYEYYYSCKELDDAVQVRDKLIEYDWDKSKIPEIKMELGL